MLWYSKKLKEIEIMAQAKRGDEWINITKRVPLTDPLLGNTKMERRLQRHRAMATYGKLLHEWLS